MRKSKPLTTKRWTRRYSEPAPEVIDPETGEQEWTVREVEIRGARIEDHGSGLRYCVTIEERRGGAAITFLSVETTQPEQSVTNSNLSHSELIRHTREVLAAERPATHDRRVSIPGVKPPLEQIALDYAKHNREALADRYGVSASTLDRWIREARDTTDPETGRPYLGRARTGRPPKRPGATTARRGTNDTPSGPTAGPNKEKTK